MITGIEEIPTHLTAEEKQALTALARLVDGATYVELGSYLGASSCCIAAGMPRTAKLYCIDTWNNDGMSEGRRDTYDEFLKNTRGFSDIIVPLRGATAAHAAAFDGEIDFLFVDAGHDYDNVQADVRNWFPKLKQGALVVFHDTGWAEGVQRVVSEQVRPLALKEGSLPNMYWAGIDTARLPRETPAYPPLLSVIIPTRNRDALLYNALESLTRQGYPAERFEVIVVDNGCTDATADVCRHFSRRLPRFKVVRDPRPGLHNGRHTGLREAAGEILVYADDDIEAFPSWLEGIAESFADPRVALAGGKILPKFESPPPDWLATLSLRSDSGWALAWYSVLDLGDAPREIPPEYVWGCNFSIRKKVLEEIGGFHPDAVPQELVRFRGDGETAVSMRIRDLGLKALYHPKASVYHVVSSERMTADYLYRRAFNQGVSDSYASIRRTRSLSPPLPYREASGTIHETVNRGVADGFNYHQQMVKADSALQRWVLKEHYLAEEGTIVSPRNPCKPLISLHIRRYGIC